jgi:hypothetical protein
VDSNHRARTPARPITLSELISCGVSFYAKNPSEADWMEPFRRFWEEKFFGLDEYLKEMQKAKTQKNKKPRGRTKR